MSITQPEFDYLIQLKKEFQKRDELLLGPAPLKWSRDIISLFSKDAFLLDYYRGSLEIKKYTYNKRYRTSIPLVRFDSFGRHTNPDGQKFVGPHIHIYKEGFDDKFAYPIDSIGADLSTSMQEVLVKFLKYCNIQNIPPIQLTF